MNSDFRKMWTAVLEILELIEGSKDAYSLAALSDFVHNKITLPQLLASYPENHDEDSKYTAEAIRVVRQNCINMRLQFSSLNFMYKFICCCQSEEMLRHKALDKLNKAIVAYVPVENIPPPPYTYYQPM